MTIEQQPLRVTPVTEILGLDVDYQTRCEHSNSPLDVFAIRHKCCGRYYACQRCHDEMAGHPTIHWNTDEQDSMGAFCGICRTEVSIRAYLSSIDRCPNCSSLFNTEFGSQNSAFFGLADVSD
ncbi:CHY zinc finger protein [Granulicella sp. L60]|uniref:CHY zinc finger protein n=1 Tax=Granulicella sp. L60 TaxID=1641866 RepID=UPI001C209D7C